MGSAQMVVHVVQSLRYRGNSGVKDHHCAWEKTRLRITYLIETAPPEDQSTIPDQATMSVLEIDRIAVGFRLLKVARRIEDKSSKVMKKKEFLSLNAGPRENLK
jgi:hypothetical protein